MATYINNLDSKAYNSVKEAQDDLKNRSFGSHAIAILKL